MRAGLEARRPETRPLKDYVKLIRTFDLVYREDPGYPKTPQAIAAEGEVYEQMGRVFTSDRYFQSAAAAYEFVISEYPSAAASRDALFRLAEVYRLDLENPEEASRAYTQFLTRYAYAPQASEARLRLKEMNRRLAARAAEEARRAEAVSGDKLSAPDAARRTVAVNDVRYWEGPNYTRIVISVEDETKFQAVRLAHPDRIVFDLPGTRLSSTLAGKAFPVGNGFLQQIRVAQFKPDVSRVVLDIEKIESYSVFSLPNPFRMIIDVHGPPELMAARLPAGPPPAAIAALTRPVPALRSKPAGKPSTPGSHAQELGRRAAGADDSRDSTGSGAKEYDQPPPDAAESAPVTSDRTGAPASDLAPGDLATESAPDTTHVRPSPQTSSGSATLTRALGLKIARIVIDPGHGGHDTGTIGPAGLEEKDVVLDVALRLRRLIAQRMGSEVVMTRHDDTFIPLEERTAIANQRAADLFISIHANASRDPSARGIEVYYLNFTSDPNSLEVAARENSTSQESVHQLQSLIKKIALTEKIEESSEFARQVDHSLDLATTRSGNRQPDRGLKKAPFVVLIGANMPSILAEISFLTDPRDEGLLSEPRYRQQIAEGLYRGIAIYVANLGSMKLAQRAESELPARRVAARISPAHSAPVADPPENWHR